MYIQFDRGNLTTALSYQKVQQQVLLHNIEELLAESVPIYAKHHLQVIQEDLDRLVSRASEENEIVAFVFMVSGIGHVEHWFPPDQTNAQLAKHALLLKNNCHDFITKHPHFIEVPEIEEEQRQIDLLIDHLNAIVAKEPNKLNLGVELQLHRIERSVVHLIEQASLTFV